jgi:hypothetical protein
MNNSSASLQQTLHLLSQWASDWQLTINVDKCLVLSISTKSVPDQPQYYINGIPVLRRNSCVDLGVTISHDLSFDSHVNNIVSGVRQRLSVLFLGFLTRNLFIMRQAFITYIRPILQYNSVIWSPTFIYLIDLLESVQRRQRGFTTRLPSLSSRTYPERLALLDLEPLEPRRLRADLIFYFKIFNNLTPFNPHEVFLIYTPIASSRSNSPYLLKPICASNKVLSTFFYRSVDAWNALPPSLRSSSSLPAFKRGLRNVDLNRYLKGSGFLKIDFNCTNINVNHR